jgi:hypothetical protein
MKDLRNMGIYRGSKEMLENKIILNLVILLLSMYLYSRSRCCEVLFM